MTQQDLQALRGIREEFEEAAGGEWPAAAAGQVMLQADVVYALGGDDRAAVDVLGPEAFAYVQDLTGGPVVQ